MRDLRARGDVHEINLPRRQGRVQHGRRYAVLLQADDLMGLSTVVICPTSQSAPSASFHPEVDLDGETSKVLCEMIKAVDGRKLGKQVGHLSVDEIRSVNDALELVLDLRR
jgi:mRNA interferase MazF